MHQLKKRVLSPLKRKLLYFISGILWLTGTFWLYLRYCAGSRGAFGSSSQTMLLKIHGAAAMAFLVVLGVILHHIRPGWRQKQQRPSGTSLLVVCVLLMLTGWGLYYEGNEQFRNFISGVHSILGFVLPGIILFHIWNVYRRLKMSESTEVVELVPPVIQPRSRNRVRKAIVNFALVIMVICIGAVLIWQGITSSGNPDPTAEHLNKFAVIMNTGILVFREGLEAILVLAALTASLVRTGQGYWKPVGLGAGLSFMASIATWFVVVGIISNINAPELDIQAGTGLLAIIVLLVIMNWFFHQIYWTGWIAHHNKRKQDIVDSSKPASVVFKGLVLVGFTSVYREGFEIVLFLQNLRLKEGSQVVLEGVMIGLILTAMVAVLTFIAHQKLPYLKMLIFTGIMLGMVMIVMVGESVQEMQQANWLGTTTLKINMPGWLNTWFAIYPSVESLLAQVFSIVLVVGSYFVAQYMSVWRSR